MNKTALLVLCILFSTCISVSNATITIKVGTIYPKSSTYGQILMAWEKAVGIKSKGELELKIYYNASLGDESAMVSKMKVDQLDAAVLTAQGLGKIYKPIFAMEMPGLFDNVKVFDSACSTMKLEFEKEMLEVGFTSMGWFNNGTIRLMTNSFSVNLPKDLQGKKPIVIRDNAMTPLLYNTIGKISSITLSVPEVITNLNTGAGNVVYATSLTAESLQWSNKLSHIGNDAEAYSIGCIVMSKKRFDDLPTNIKTILKETSKVSIASLNKKIRFDDEASFMRFKSSKNILNRTAEEKSGWADIYNQFRKLLSQTVFTEDFIKRMETLAGK